MRTYAPVTGILLVCLGFLSCQTPSSEQEAEATPEKRILGVSPWSNPDYELMREGGIGWVRMGFAYPFKDELGGELSEDFVEDLEEAKKVRAAGLRIMGITPLAGMTSYDEADGQIAWRPRIPEWAGTHDDNSYYEAYEKGCEEIGRQTRDLVELWQVSNEMDHAPFRGPLSLEQAARFLEAGGRGIERGNPESRSGINPAGLGENGRWLVSELYSKPDCPFEFAGIDGYFGSWGSGGPEDWVPVIDELHEMTGKPVLIHEWGYSSNAGSGKPLDRKVRSPVCQRQSWGNSWRGEHSPEVQAEYIKIALKIFATYPNVMGSFIYSWGDDDTCYSCGEPNCPAECGWGMVDSAGNPKPAYHVIQEISEQYY